MIRRRPGNTGDVLTIAWPIRKKPSACCAGFLSVVNQGILKAAVTLHDRLPFFNVELL